MKDIIIILPGILGSVLQKDGKDLWAVSDQAILQVLTNLSQTIHNLKLGQSARLSTLTACIDINVLTRRLDR